jgi:hypothetical protein
VTSNGAAVDGGVADVGVGEVVVGVVDATMVDGATVDVVVVGASVLVVGAAVVTATVEAVARTRCAEPPHAAQTAATTNGAMRPERNRGTASYAIEPEMEQVSVQPRVG